MTDKNEIIEQTNLAFDFIQKLYLEVSYLIKEIEAILREEVEKFIIGKPGGYSVTARSSTGLESASVSLWLFRKFGVFFVPDEKTEIQGGVTTTKLDKDLKVLYLRFLLNDRSIEEPVVYSGVLHNIVKKHEVKGIKKFEHLMGHFEYNDVKIFKDVAKIDYEDAYINIKGELIKNNLFEINDTETILEKIINPSLALYRRY